MPRSPARPGLYLVTLLGSLLGSFGLFYLLLIGLGATGNLPPPGFSNSICVDEKLAYLRQQPALQPNLLVIGSSIAWRHFDGDVVRQAAPQAVPLNGAFCGLTANQSAYTGDWYVRHYPSIREVLLIAAPQDFENCGRNRTAIFDADDADAYVFGDASPWPYYVKYFAPGALLRNASNIGARRRGGAVMDPLVFDRYGSGPLETDGFRDTLLYGAVQRFDQACFDALAGFAARLRQQGRRLMVAATPLHPVWKRLHDADGAMQAGFNTRIRGVLQANGGEYWDGDAAGVVQQAGFYDGIHLRWSAVAPFSSALAQRFRFGGVPASPGALRASAQ